MKKILLSSVLLLLLSCSEDVLPTSPPIPEPSIEPTNGIEVEDLEFEISYPSYWNIQEQRMVNLEVFSNRENFQVLFSWRNPMGVEMSRSSFLTHSEVRGLSHVMAYVTLIEEDGTSSVRQTEIIQVIDDSPKELHVMLTFVENRLFAIAVPYQSWNENRVMGDDFWMMGYAIEPPVNQYGYYDEYDSPEWEMTRMAEFFRGMDEDLEYEGGMSMDEMFRAEKERLREESKVNRVNVLHYEWYFNDDRVPVDHYSVDLPTNFQGQVRLVVYGEGWEMFETVRVINRNET